MGGSFRHAPSLADPEKQRARPVHAGDPPGDLRKRAVALALILDRIGEDADRMRVLMPFANQLGARLQRDGGRGGQSARVIRAFRESTQPPLYGKAQATESAFLNPVGDATD